MLITLRALLIDRVPADNWDFYTLLVVLESTPYPARKSLLIKRRNARDEEGKKEKRNKRREGNAFPRAFTET